MCALFAGVARLMPVWFVVVAFSWVPSTGMTHAIRMRTTSLYVAVTRCFHFERGDTCLFARWEDRVYGLIDGGGGGVGGGG